MNKIKKALAMTVLAGSLGAGALAVAPPEAEAMPNIGGIIDCLLHSDGDLVYQDGQFYCVLFEAFVVAL